MNSKSQLNHQKKLKETDLIEIGYMPLNLIHQEEKLRM